MVKIKFTEEDLIELVRKKACIYDPSARNHADKTQVKNAWKSIADKFEEDYVTGKARLFRL